MFTACFAACFETECLYSLMLRDHDSDHLPKHYVTFKQFYSQQVYTELLDP